MQITISIALYVLGCVLAYGRMKATSRGYGVDMFFIFVLFSWGWLLAGLVSWIIDERHDGIKFLKF